jgi:hypothetical protein
MRDRPPILAFLLLFTAMLAVVTALAAVNEALTQAEQPPSGARPESQSHPFLTNRQEKAT